MKIKNILLCALVAMSISSCETTLDLYPESYLTSDVYFKKESDFKLYANGLYSAQLPDFGVCSSDNMTDLYYVGGANTVSNSTYIEAQNDGNWSGPYAGLRNAYVLIEAEAEIEDPLIKASIQIYKGEAYFFVAQNYFNLLRYYGGVPLITSTLDLDSEELYCGRNSREEVVDYIMECLDKAIAAPVGTTDASQEGRLTVSAVRAFKARVALFEGTWRKYHGLGGEAKMFDIAVSESKKVLEDPAYSLFKATDRLGELSYFYMYTLESESGTLSNPAGIGKEANKSYILSRKHNKLDSPTGYISATSGNLSPTLKMMNMFLDSKGLPIDNPNSNFQGHGFDIDPVTKIAYNKEYVNRDPRMRCNLIEPFTQFWYHAPYNRNYSLTDETGTGAWNDGFWTSATGYLLCKFLPEIEGNVGIDYPIIRLEEVMLIYAEASYEKNGTITDKELDLSINKLRDRVDMPHLTNGFVAANGLNMLTEIRRERTVELMAEGFRYDDVRRWKVAEKEMSESLKGVQWANSDLSNTSGFDVYSPFDKTVKHVEIFASRNYTTDADGFIILEDASKRKFTEKYYLRPIPLRQIALSDGAIEQNPGWLAQ